MNTQQAILHDRMVWVIGSSWAVAYITLRLAWSIVKRLATFAALLVPTLAVAPLALFLSVMFGQTRTVRAVGTVPPAGSDIEMLKALAAEETRRVRHEARRRR